MDAVPSQVSALVSYYRQVYYNSSLLIGCCMHVIFLSVDVIMIAITH